MYIFTFLVLSLCSVIVGTLKVINPPDYNHSKGDRVFYNGARIGHKGQIMSSTIWIKLTHEYALCCPLYKKYHSNNIVDFYFLYKGEFKEVFMVGIGLLEKN